MDLNFAFSGCVFALGIAIGLRYSIFALIPALFGLIFFVFAVDTDATGGWPAAATWAVSVQGGYMVGLTARSYVKNLLSHFSAAFRIT